MLPQGTTEEEERDFLALCAVAEGRMRDWASGDLVAETVVVEGSEREQVDEQPYSVCFHRGLWGWSLHCWSEQCLPEKGAWEVSPVTCLRGGRDWQQSGPLPEWQLQF